MSRVYIVGHTVGHAGALWLARCPTAMSPAEHPDAWVRVGLRFEVESFDRLEDGTGFYCWMRRADGAGVLWQLDLRRPPGTMQSVSVIEGA
jgi:hypothetical protein